MKLLLDTHTFVWFAAGTSLGRRATEAIEDPKSELYLSAASAWEMSIKLGLKKLSLPLPLEDYLREKASQGVRPLPIDWRHATAVRDLPPHHRDPFDRMLAAQAIVEDMTLVSADKAFKDYKVKLIW